MSKYLNETTKKMLMILLGIAVVFIIVFIGMFIYKSIVGTKVSYEKLKTITETAGMKYFSDKQLLPVDGESAIVSIDTLITYDYMKPLNKLTNDPSCTGKVKVNNNGGYYLYNTYLDCQDYQTTTFMDELRKQVVEKDAGLYKVQDEYIFKGEFVNNYVTFAGTTWRIMLVDRNGYMKLVKEEQEQGQFVWDNRYNSSVKEAAGINDYAVSRLREKVQSIYNNRKVFSEDALKYIVPHTLCVGKRSLQDTALNPVKDCEVALENEYIGVINSYEYSNASLDPECTSVLSPSCRNYNYLSDILNGSWTITASAENTYEAYVTFGGKVRADKASNYNAIHIAIYMDSNIIYQGGDGSKTNPYVVN